MAVPPPSAPNFASGTAASYGVFGTSTSNAESGGKLLLDTANGLISVNAVVEPGIGLRVRFQADIDPLNLRAGLKSDDTLQWGHVKNGV